jgi:cytochrome c oxidase subunit 3
MLTGFHGFHVLVGTLMLMVVHARLRSGDFTPKHHFYFEAAAWYWHFVDVVWVGLYLFVYFLA